MKTHLKVLLLAFITFNAVAQSSKWEKFDFSNSLIPFEKIFCIEFDKKGNVFFGTNVTNDLGHIGIFDGTNFTVTSKGKWVYDIKCDSKGNIWTLNSSSELAKWDGTSWSFISNPDLGWYSNPMHIDGNDHIWANPAFESKLLEYDGTQWKTYDLTNSKFPDDHISCIITSGKDLFIGTNDSGLAHFNGISWITYKVSNSMVPDDRIYASCKDQQDTLWFVTRGGFIFGIKDNSWVIYQHNDLNEFTNQIDVDSKGNFWISQTNRIVKYDKKNATVYDYTNSILPRYSVNTIAVDTFDKVWIGTRYGLFSYQENFDSIIEIIEQPKNLSIHIGDTAEFSIKAKGSNLIYQWQKNGSDIINATSAVYKIIAVKTTDAGMYKCLVSNGQDILESNEVKLTVNSESDIYYENITPEFRLYPVPVKGFITIFFRNNGQNYRLEVIDNCGKVIKTHELITEEYTIDLSKLSSGNYLIRLLYNGRIISKQFIIF